MQMVQCLQEITPAMVAKLYLMPARLIRPDILPGAFSFPSAGGRVNFAHYLGRASEEAGFLDGASRFPSSNLVNILGDAHYMLPNKILFGVDLGVGMILYNGATNSGFARIIYGGYEWDGGSHTYTFSLFFDQTTYQKNLGLRAAIRL